MKTIKKTYATDKQAVSYQNRLYNKYDSVKLIYAAFHTYIWEVK